MMRVGPFHNARKVLKNSANELLIMVIFTAEVFTSTPGCVIHHCFICRCYHKTVNGKTNTSVQVYFRHKDVTDEQFETITNP